MSRASRTVLDALAELGPEGAPLVDALADMSDEELARLEAYYGQPRETGHHGEPDTCRVHGGEWDDCAAKHPEGGRDKTSITDFLLARIAEDEDLARHPHAARVAHTIGCAVHPQGLEDTRCDCAVPARVLVECEARRGVLEVCSFWADNTDERADPNLDRPWWRNRVVADQIEKFLALPYADHPNYHPEWRP